MARHVTLADAGTLTPILRPNLRYLLLVRTDDSLVSPRDLTVGLGGRGREITCLGPLFHSLGPHTFLTNILSLPV